MGIPVEQAINKDLIDHFICNKCSDLVVDVIILKTCEHLFCRSCIVDWIATQKQSKSKIVCPSCDDPFTAKDFIKTELQISGSNPKIKNF